MKKLRSFSALLLCLSVAFATAACSKKPNAHTHTYATGWTNDGGYHWHVSDCGHDSVSDKSSHSCSVHTVAPTCTEQGYTERTCIVCGYSYIGDYVNALGHDLVSQASKAPTCTEDGYLSYGKCSRCDYSEEPVVDAATGHSFSAMWTRTADEHWREATCGHEEITDFGSHTFNGRICSACGYVDESPTEGLSYTLLSDNTYSVKKGDATDVDVYIPRTYLGKPITALGSMAFSNYKTLRSIVLPDTLKEIGGRAFDTCTALTELNIPEGVTKIGVSAFTGCSNLAHVSIPDSVTSIGTDAFNKCASLVCENYSGALYLGNENNPHRVLLKAQSTGITACEVHADTEMILYQAFKGCASLGTVSLPDGLKIIDGQTFMGCSSLTSIVVPDSVELIGGFAFNGCSGLEEITLPFTSGQRCVADVQPYPFGYIFGTGSYTGGVKISQTWTYNGTQTAFYYIPEGLRHVTLTGGNMPNKITATGEYLLTGTFRNCSMIEVLTLPLMIKTLSYDALAGCTGLTDIYYGGTATQWANVAKSNNTTILEGVTVHCADD